ncbi:MAG: hypothetical protein LKJ17_02540 [Oscillospiraceae bacterium]|nr:hypothetical protein [Oscillospiraceae bacterium]
MFNGGGSASILRMFNTTLGGQDSWLLPFGLFSALAMLIGMRKAEQEGRRKRLCGLLMWGGAVAVMVGYFSVAQFFHPYYISAMAPYLAALTGIGLTELWRLYRSGGLSGYLLPVSFVVTAAVQGIMLWSYPEYFKILLPVLCVIVGIPSILLVLLRFLRKNTVGKLGMLCLTIGFAGLLITPAVWTGYSALSTNINSAIPTAGPSSESGSMFGKAGGISWQQNTPDDGEAKESTEEDASQKDDGRQNGAFGNRADAGSDSSSSTALIRFLEENNTGEKWLVAVPSASEAEPIILATGKPVMAIGGFSGDNQSLTVEKLEQMVQSGELKYFMTGGRGNKGGTSSDAVTQWVEEHGTVVDSSVWSTSGNSDLMGGASQTLYDLSAYRSES